MRGTTLAAAVAMPIALATPALAQIVTYKCGNEATIRVDTINQIIIWISPDGTQEVHRAQIDDAYVVWDMRLAAPMRIDRRTGLTEHWAADDKNWQSTEVTCSLER
jgi:hypothetical protein